MAIQDLEDFAETVYKILRSDRDVVIAVGGMTGEGKSCFTSKFTKAYSTKANTYWGFDRMTWSRKEMMVWIDGEGKTKEGRLPEYSIVMPDELFGMFYARNWYEDAQIDAISTFNMCRDRHLLVMGNVPNFWQLDSGFLTRVRFYAFIPRRGVAWIFEQTNNPFTKDVWNVNENRKTFQKYKNPYKCPNFLCELHYDDWDADEKKEYYEIRNTKRVESIQENKSDKVERYSTIKAQRDKLIRIVLKETKYTLEEVGEAIDMSKGAVSMIRNEVM